MLAPLSTLPQPALEPGWIDLSNDTDQRQADREHAKDIEGGPPEGFALNSIEDGGLCVKRSVNFEARRSLCASSPAKDVYNSRHICTTLRISGWSGST